jgi:hypothetical protein
MPSVCAALFTEIAMGSMFMCVSCNLPIRGVRRFKLHMIVGASHR